MATSSTNFGVLGRASVDIDVRLDKLQAEFGQARRQVERGSRQMTRSINQVERSIAGATAASLKWGAALVGITSVAAVGNLVRRTAELGDELAKTSRALNISVEALQQLRFVAERTGVEVNQFDEGLRRFVRRLGLFVQNGGGPAAQAFEDLGLASRIASQELRSTEDTLEAAFVALEGVTDASERAALASQLFGDRVGTQFALVARIGATERQKLIDEITEIGLISTETATASEELQDALTNLDKATTALGNSLGPVLLPALTDLINFIVEEAIPAFSSFSAVIFDLLGLIVRPFRAAAQEWERLLTGTVASAEEASEAFEPLTIDITEYTEAVSQGSNTLATLNEELVKFITNARAAAEGQRALQAGIVPPDLTRDQALEENAAEDQVERFRQAEAAARQFADVFGRSFEDAIFSTDSLTDSLKGLVEELVRVAVRLAVIQPLVNALTGAFTGPIAASGVTGSTTAGTGGVFSGLGTGGGIVSRPTFIPTMATGGVIAGERGREAIIPLERMLGRGFSFEGGGQQGVQIIDQRGAQAPDIQRRTVNGPGGQEILQLIIREQVNGMFADGSIDNNMGAFGLTRKGTARG